MLQMVTEMDMKVFCVSSSDYMKLNNLLTCEDDDNMYPAVSAIILFPSVLWL